MTDRSIPVAAVQLRAHDRTAFAQRWPRILTTIDEAARSGAQLIVLPECTVPAYVIGTEPVDPKVLASALRDVEAAARRTGATIVIGMVRSERGVQWNAAVAVTSAGVAGSAEKLFLWHFDTRWFAPGEMLEPVDTPVGRLGLFICADGRIPTIASTLVDRGAEILVMPTAWVTSGRDPQSLENVQADLIAAVRARENGVPLIAANKCGVEAGSVAYCGKSLVVDAQGNVLARASQHEEEIITARVVLEPPPIRPSLPARAYPPVDRSSAPVRVAISARADARLQAAAREQDAQLIIDPRFDLDGGNDALVVDDRIVLDPRALVAAKLAGIRLIVWDAELGGQLQVAFARTRAVELRVYVVVIDRRNDRAYAVDPDGVVLCGTFDGFAVAAFTLDPARTEQTRVAPHTDILAGMRHVEAIAETLATP